MKPNIFELATKELSQDAFFTWLIQWADSINKAYDNNLNDCAQSFVQLLINSQINYDKAIQKVIANRQWHNIDIWAEINDEIFIIIEDKTFTTKHSDQLATYKEIAQKYCIEKGFKLVCIYLKTGSESISSLKLVEKDGFAVVERKILVEFLNHHKEIKNEIFTDFKIRINNLEDNTNSFKCSKIKNWNWNSWEGFYTFLQENIKVQDWKYVSNPGGGFLGLWWHFLEWKDYYVYLQIEQGNLCFKVGEVYKNRSAVRNEWHNIIALRAKEKGYNEIERPKRFGTGTYMTVAIVEKQNWLGEDESLADLEAIILKLKKYEIFLNDCL